MGASGPTYSDMSQSKTDISDGALTPGRMFYGAKAAVLMGPHMPVLLRDDNPEIPWPGYLDLPGGGREKGESPLQCALRETIEELSLHVTPSEVHWGRSYRDLAGREVWFFVARLDPARAADIRMGDEGQGWQMILPDAYIAHPKGIPPFQARLRDYLSRP